MAFENYSYCILPFYSGVRYPHVLTQCLTNMDPLNPRDEQVLSGSSPAAAMGGTFTVNAVSILFEEIDQMPKAHIVAGAVMVPPPPPLSPTPSVEAGPSAFGMATLHAETRKLISLRGNSIWRGCDF